jgi:hypothetical protein
MRAELEAGKRDGNRHGADDHAFGPEHVISLLRACAPRTRN